MPRLISIVLILFLSLISVYGGDVEVNSDIMLDKTLFNYSFNFGENESYSSFSFEKPKDATIISAVNEDGESLSYKVAGDYFIFKPDDTNGKKFNIIFESKVVSEDVLNKNSFSVYLNFNFPVENLIFQLNLGDKEDQIQEIFPRNYEVLGSGEIVWEIGNIEEDTLFLVNFEGSENTENSSYNLFLIFSIIFGLILFIVVLLVFVFLRQKKSSKSSKSLKNTENNISKENNIESEEENIKESFEDFTAKYLTENEKEVVEVIKENEGISQYDILNFIPSLTKSNLSKIISKLNAKRILDRVRVGKVNKIYLGDRLKNGNGGDKK